MIRIRKVYISLLFFVCSTIAWSQSRLGLSVGVPLAFGQSTFGKAYLLETDFTYVPHKRSGFGVGVNYIKSDLPNEGFILTYDRSSLSFYAIYNYRFSFASGLSILPEVQAGYTFSEGELNQDLSYSDKLSAPYVATEVNLVYRLSNRIETTLGIGISHVFAYYQLPEDLTIPAVYFPGDNRASTFYKFKVGVDYLLTQ